MSIGSMVEIFMIKSKNKKSRLMNECIVRKVMDSQAETSVTEA